MPFSLPKTFGSARDRGRAAVPAALHWRRWQVRSPSHAAPHVCHVCHRPVRKRTVRAPTVPRAPLKEEHLPRRKKGSHDARAARERRPV
jgi:hypothetical protein